MSADVGPSLRQRVDQPHFPKYGDRSPRRDPANTVLAHEVALARHRGILGQPAGFDLLAQDSGQLQVQRLWVPVVNVPHVRDVNDVTGKKTLNYVRLVSNVCNELRSSAMTTPLVLELLTCHRCDNGWWAPHLAYSRGDITAGEAGDAVLVLAAHEKAAKLWHRHTFLTRQPSE